MFRIEVGEGPDERVLVAPDGDKIPVRKDVWERLRNPDQIFSEWKSLLQKWSIHVEKAPLLKRECPSDHEYRQLRTMIRTSGEA